MSLMSDIGAAIKTRFDRNASAMTKAQFNALAEERKANRAGSGFDEMGKHRTTSSTTANINEGMWCISSSSNSIVIGDTFSPIGTSKTNNAQAVTNGNILKMSFINDTSSRAYINLPTAPNIYPYDTVLTAEQIASGVIKHADASNSGLIVNGKFDTDTSGWTAYYNGVLSVVGNKLSIIPSVYSASRATQPITTVVGKKYVIEVEITNNNANIALIGVSNSADGAAAFVYNTTTVSGVSLVKFEFTATAITTYISLSRGTSSTTEILYDNIAVYPADAISRSDLVFLELTTSNAA